jgi:hydrogenase nickel incorporation protein HypA/HybF
MSIMHNILAVVDKTAQQQQATKVTRIDLTIGVRAGVVADALTFAFEAMSPHTLAAGAELVITEIQLCFRCPGCGLESTENQELCPACHLFFEVVRGRELQITSIEIE